MDGRLNVANEEHIMKRYLAGMVALLFTTGLVLSAEKKPTKQTGPAAELADIQKEYGKEVQEAIKVFRSAKTDEDRNAAVNRLVPFGDRAVKLAEQNSGDPAALDALVWTLRTVGGMPATDKTKPLVQRTLKLLAKDYVKNDKIGKVCLMIGQMATQGETGESATELLKAVLENGKSKDAKGLACYALAQAAAARLESAEDDASKATAATKDAEQYYDRVLKEFSSVKVDNVTLEEMATPALFELRNLAIGKSPPETVSRDLEGKPVKLSDLRGKVVVLDIWATWCPPCRAMIPHERELVKRLNDKPFALVSISADDEAKTVKDFLTKEPMPWTHWHSGPTEGIVKAWNVRYFPTIYVLDAKGIIRYKGVRGEAMDKAVDTLLKETQNQS